NNPRNTNKRGIAWERPASVEYLVPADGSGFQIDCGLRVQGGDYIRGLYNPNSSSPPEGKFSFRLYFRGDYGEGTLHYPLFGDSPVRDFDRVVLRAGMNDPTNPFLVDELMRRLMTDTGQVTARGGFAYLYLNGVYKGYYNPTEGYEEDFLRSWQGGGKSWDLITQGEIANAGDNAAFVTMLNYIRNNNMATAANYARAARMLDMTNFVDYLLVNIYGATGDWPGNNWRAARERVPGALIRYYMWDAEWALGNQGRSVSANEFSDALGSSSEIGQLYQRLKSSPEFKLLFADRAQKHFFNNGALADARVLARFNEMYDQLRPVISGLQTTIRTSWVPNRRANIFKHMTSAGLPVSTNVPVFSQFGGRVPRGYSLTMSNAVGDIYYTTNGVDPRVPFTSGVLPEAWHYDGKPIPIEEDTRVTARSLAGTNWSALADATFTAGSLGVPVRFTEIMFHPQGGDAYEFIELQNTGGVPVDLTLMTLEGVAYTFPLGATLAPGATLVLASSADPASFAKRYPGVKVFGTYGGALSNSGERLALLDRKGGVVTTVDFFHGPGWPKETDGSGFSLEVGDANGDPNDPANWRASAAAGGSPGLIPASPATSIVEISEIMAENQNTITNDGTAPDWIELHNRGSGPADLAGWSLSDDDPRRFVFPAGTVLAGNGYLVIWCDSQTNAPGLHTGFALNRQGESVFLYNAKTSRVDGVTFGQQLADYSLGRVADRWVLNVPTPNGANLAAELAPQSDLILNEWLANPAPGGDDWIELLNRNTAKPAALEGIYIATSNALFRALSHSFVAPGGFIKLVADGKANPDHVDLKLPSTGGLIVLSDATGAEINRVAYALQATGISEGRYPDGGTNVVKFPGSASGGTANYVPTYAGPVLNEVMVAGPPEAPAGWVELYNSGDQAQDLGGVSLGIDSAKPDWFFPAGALIPAKGYLVVSLDESSPASVVASSRLNTGRATSADGGGLYLFNAARQLVDSVEFGFQIPGFSIGRMESGWSLTGVATPGAINTGQALTGSAADLRINEWLAGSPSGRDWVELYNAGGLPVSLAGLYVTDDPSLHGQTNFVVGPLTYIGPGGFVEWVADGDPSLGRNHLNFKLDTEGETIRIYQADKSLVDAVDFGAQWPGVSEGRYPDGSTNVVQFLEGATPGRPNSLEPNSRLRIDANSLNAGLLILRFEAQPGATYVIEATDSLSSGNWRTQAAIPSGNAAREVTQPVPLPANSREMYFRLTGSRSQ
ncbi:MAG TPA: lamin tail domain-containing protein, partial [Verrucomicrobiae bacterium]|nr:lamin tail domain-containing protein [Verrucomicrobiae bacterium]